MRKTLSSSSTIATLSPPSALRRTAEIRDSGRALSLWHLLSLDAPTVATVWTWYIAHAAHLRLPASTLVAMFTAVWMLYAADRLLDSRPLRRAGGQTSRAVFLPGTDAAETCANWCLARQVGAGQPGLEARHIFHHRHRRPLSLALWGCALLLVALIPRLGREVLRLDVLLGALLMAYFVLVHATRSAHRLPKEISVGLFFSAAVFIPTVARTPELRLQMLPVALLFAALCSLNCLLIYRWEHPPGTYRRDPAAPHWLTRTAIRHLPVLAWTIAVLGALLAVLTQQILFAPITCAALLLLALHQRRRRFAPTLLRATADLVLLTPLPLLLLQHAR